MTSVHPDSKSLISGTSSISGISELTSSGSVAFLRKEVVSEWEVFLFMMAMVLGAQYRQWNVELDSGYWFSFIKLLYVGSNYGCSALCMAEIASALPFSGGIYGVVRATMGPFAGYTVACSEVLMNISYVTVVVSFIAGIPAVLYSSDETIEVLSIIAVYMVVAVVCILGGKVFWTFSGLFGTTTLVLVLIYIIGSLSRTTDHSVDFQGNCDNISWEYSFVSMITNRAVAASAFRGIQYLPLFSEMLPNPKVQVPRLMVVSMGILIVTVISLLTTSCSQYPGPIKLSGEKEPMAYGFAAIFGISWDGGVGLHLPGLIASSFGFVYCAGRQLYKISESSLLPKIFMGKTPYFGTSYVGLLFVTIICGILTVSGVYNRDVITLLENVTVIITAFIYVMSGVSYLYFHFHLSELQRSFRNPFGIYGAIYAILTFSIAIISGTFLKGVHGFIAGAICAAFLLGVWIFYYVYMAKHQHFSDEEREMMFKAYLIRANRANRKRGGKKKNKITPHGPGSVSSVSSAGTRSRTGSRPELKNGIAETNTSAAVKQDSVSSAEIVDPEEEGGINTSNPAGTLTRALHLNTIDQTPSSSLPTSFSQKIVESVSGKLQQILAPLGSVSKEMMNYQQLAVAADGGLMGGSNDYNEEVLDNADKSQKEAVEIAEEGEVLANSINERDENDVEEGRSLM